MGIGRRQFIKNSLVGIGSAVLGSSCGASVVPDVEVPSHFDPAQIVPLGKTGLKVSRVGIGTGMRSSNRQSNQTRAGQEHFNAYRQRRPLRVAYLSGRSS